MKKPWEICVGLKMRILIAGITGRIGANLSRQLIDRGHRVRGLVWLRDPRTEKLKKMGVELLDGSLTDQGDVARSVEGGEVVYLVEGGGKCSVVKR